MNDFIQNKVMPPMMKFLNTRAISAIKNGMIYPIPFIIIGSVFLILANLPIPALATAINNSGWGPLMGQINNASFGIMALLAVFGISYSYVRDAGFEGVSAGLTGIICHILLQPDTIKSVVSITDPTKTSTAYQVTGVINRTWLGGQGMVLSIIVGLLVGFLYTGFLRRNITIKMPEQVPSNVSASFTALIPAAVIITLAGLVNAFFVKGLQTTFVEWVYKVIQTPLQHVTDGPVGVFVIAFLPVFIWWFGVHGAAIIGGIMGPLLQANAADNQYVYHYDTVHHMAFRLGQTVDGHTTHIVTQAFMDQYLTVTGSGLTIGLVIFLLVGAKSVQMQTLGKMEVGPMIFNINEPVLFGLPVVLNPILAVPFIFMPLISGVLTYLVIMLHIIPPFTGAIVPWTTPGIISGFLAGGWQAALWQAVIFVIAIVVYWPFSKAYDNILLKEEAEQEAEIQAEKAEKA
ncbi:PTS sugar transporter subunit IIC [Lactococcus hircilactis]|uniref:Permease IIC component n=1 Tax=Lactococcus hircilactis TaxID=1494462 RepID=A0A7X1Z879_9LACT|nr:PTS sugar transporter subunit IIC [Lactococcus hircilactis]MQW38551.1 PTS sugar transporter subunit IIC [Lactococcus hircilactis]